MTKSILITLLIFVAILAGIWSASAAVMSSSSYKIQSDSLNTGGDAGSSASYINRDTVGEFGSSDSTSASYILKAGYRPLQEVYLALSAPASVTLTPAIGGLSGGTGNATASLSVITDNPAGYTLTIKASTNPALTSGASSFGDYTPAVGGTPDYNWSVGASAAEFGFTPEGADIPVKYKDNGASCSTGSSDAVNSCWYNLSLTDETIAQNAAANHPTGIATNLKLRAESGASNYQAAGDYSAQVIITALAP